MMGRWTRSARVLALVGSVMSALTWLSYAWAAGPSIGPNVNLTRAPGNQYETAVAVDPKNNQHIFVASRNEVGGLYCARSSDGGATWTSQLIATGASGGLPRAYGNASVAWDGFGNLFLVYLAATLSDPADDGLYLSLAVNARGDAAVAYTLSPYSSYATGTFARYVFRSGPDGTWSAPVTVSETLPSSAGYITNPQVALDKNGLATVTYLGHGVEATSQLSGVSWTSPQVVLAPPTVVSSFQSIDLALDANGNAIVGASIFDATINVDRASVWVATGDTTGHWRDQTRLTDPTASVDAYATRVAMSPDGALVMVGWIDHYHGTVQVATATAGGWSIKTIGRGTAFSAFQEVLGLDAAASNVACAIWKNAKSGTRTMAAMYGK